VEETIQRERLDAPSSADAAPSCAALIVRLEALRRSMLEAEARLRDLKGPADLVVDGVEDGVARRRDGGGVRLTK